MNHLSGAMADYYIDDVAVYDGTAVDNTAPDAPTSPAVTVASSTSLAVSWTAPTSGVDGGGYLVVRGTSSDPTTAPNTNGIYAVGNTVATGQTVVYIGTGTSFTNSSLATGTYYYRIYTFDKAFNYSTAAGGAAVSGKPCAPTPTVTSDSPICAGATLHLYASAVSDATYAWTGPNGFTSSAQNPTVVAAT
ncbi:MAG: fibronectin type III domain-containing protein, partial [Verrucomicrobia bacterium]|nr:fibronectin type III domain-containing protein [Verrucomicrobiota bacterium]